MNECNSVAEPPISGINLVSVLLMVPGATLTAGSFSSPFAVLKPLLSESPLRYAQNPLTPDDDELSDSRVADATASFDMDDLASLDEVRKELGLE